MRYALPLALTALMLAIIALASTARAGEYPVSGRWGESNSTDKGAINCSGKRVIAFNGDRRTDSKGGVPAYRNLTVTREGNAYRIVDEFSTGQIRGGRTTSTLRQIDADHLEMKPQGGATLKLQRCQ